MANEDLLKKAVAAFNALSPDQQAEMLEEQRQSWVRGNVGLSRDERDMTSPMMRALKIVRETNDKGRQALQAWADSKTRPAPAATDTGLVTVAYQYKIPRNGHWDNLPSDWTADECKAYDKQETRELVTRSQAVGLLSGRDTVIEMQADSIDKLERKVRHWQERADKAEELLAAERAWAKDRGVLAVKLALENSGLKGKIDTLEADNAAQAARIKELGDYAREATKAITGLTGGGSENFGKEIGDVFTADLPYCVERIRERYVSKVELKRLEAKLTAAEKALEARDALINNLVKHVDALPDDAEFYGLAAMWASRLALMLGEARAALGGKSS